MISINATPKSPPVIKRAMSMVLIGVGGKGGPPPCAITSYVLPILNKVVSPTRVLVACLMLLYIDNQTYFRTRPICCSGQVAIIVLLSITCQ